MLPSALRPRRGPCGPRPPAPSESRTDFGQHGPLRRGGVEGRQAEVRPVAHQPVKQQAGIRDRGLSPPLAETGGTRKRARALRTDLEASGDGLVQPGQAASTDPDGLDVHARHRDPQTEFQGPIGPKLRLAVLESCHIEAGPAHVRVTAEVRRRSWLNAAPATAPPAGPERMVRRGEWRISSGRQRGPGRFNKPEDRRHAGLGQHAL